MAAGVEEILISLPTPIVFALAISQGWTPEIEDETQPMDGDTYPMIANPVSAPDFIKQIAPAFLSELVLNGARERVMADFNSVYLSVQDQVKSGVFDEQLLAGDFDGIKDAVRAQL